MHNNRSGAMILLSQKVVISIFIALLFSLSVVPAQAKNAISFEGQANGYGLDVCNKSGDCASYNIEVYGKLWSLVGEPVVYCSARWSLRSVQLRGNGDTKGATYFKKDVPGKVWENITLYNVQVMLPFISPNGSGSHIFDMPCEVGSLYGSGSKKPSFSTPGSPSWDRLFIDRRYMKGSDYNYYSAEEARAFFKHPKTDMWRKAKSEKLNDLLGDKIIKASINLNSIKAWHSSRQAAKLEKQLVKTKKKYTGKEDDFDSFFDGIDQEKKISQSLKEQKKTYNNSSAEENRIKQELRQKRSNLKSSICEEGTLNKLDKTNSLKSAANIVFNAYNKCLSSADKYERFKDEKKDKYGFKLPSGKILLPAQYDYVSNFSEGLAYVKDESGGRYYYINHQGKQVVPGDFGDANPFSEGVAPVRDRDVGRLYFINRQGKQAVPGDYYSTDSFSQGLAAVRNRDGGPWSFINKSGQKIFSRTWFHAYSFSEGLAAVCAEQNNCYYINKQGLQAFDGSWREALSFSKGLAHVTDKSEKVQLIDRKGKSISGRYDEIGDFSNGLAYVRLNNKSGFINTSGKEVIRRRFTNVGGFNRQGHAKVSNFIRSKDGKKCGQTISYYDEGLIDKKGNWVKGPDRVRHTSQSLCFQSK